MSGWDLLRTRAYVPYSGVPELAVAVGNDGRRYPGVRVENASFPLTIHAVQAALFGCMANGAEPVAVLLPPGVDLEAAGRWGWPVQTVETLSSRFAEVVKPEPGDPQVLKTRAVVPHSSFPVVAFVRYEAGWITGVNIEVPDWQLGLCAERIAIAIGYAHGLGAPLEWDIHAFRGDFISPCGACRQVLAEHGRNNRVRLHHPDGSMSDHSVADLLPHSFSGSHLRIG